MNQSTMTKRSILEAPPAVGLVMHGSSARATGFAALLVRRCGPDAVVAGTVYLPCADNGQCTGGARWMSPARPKRPRYLYRGGEDPSSGGSVRPAEGPNLRS
jgi:hypothetical protein